MQRPKYSATTTQIMDFTSKIRNIMESTSCKKHGAIQGMPCWLIASDRSGHDYAAICRGRIAQLFNGTVSTLSMYNKRPHKERA